MKEPFNRNEAKKLILKLLQEGTWRYRVHTERMAVVVTFVSESKVKLVTAWRKKK